MTDGVEKGRMRVTRFNPPGRAQLAYRACEYDDVAERMLEILRSPDGAAGSPLARLNTDAKDDWSVALVYAWSAALDVLSFYQERIANERFLATAVERRSVHEILRGVGCELRPAIAASAHLVFEVLEEAGVDERIARVPAGTRVQSVPEPGSMPQTFETTRELVASSLWNHVRLQAPEPAHWAELLGPDVCSVRLPGSEDGVRPGEKLLLVGDARDGESGSDWRLVEVARAESGRGGAYLNLSWDDEQELGAGHALSTRPGVFAFGNRWSAHLHPTTGCSRSAGADSAFRPAGVGLPEGPVSEVLRTRRGHLIVATDEGPFVSTDDAESWKRAATTVPVRVQALAELESGDLFAGTESGEILRSRDGGFAWQMVSGEPRRNPRWLGRIWILPFRRSLPNTVVRRLGSRGRRGSAAILAATDDGVYRSQDGGRGWRPWNSGLPTWNPLTGKADVPIWDFATHRRRGIRRTYAATERGVFPLSLGMAFWILVMLLGAFTADALGRHVLSSYPLFYALAGRVGDVLDGSRRAVVDGLEDLLGTHAPRFGAASSSEEARTLISRLYRDLESSLVAKQPARTSEILRTFREARRDVGALFVATDDATDEPAEPGSAVWIGGDPRNGPKLDLWTDRAATLRAAFERARQILDADIVAPAGGPADAGGEADEESSSTEPAAEPWTAERVRAAIRAGLDETDPRTRFRAGFAELKAKAEQEAIGEPTWLEAELSDAARRLEKALGEGVAEPGWISRDVLDDVAPESEDADAGSASPTPSEDSAETTADDGTERLRALDVALNEFVAIPSLPRIESGDAVDLGPWLLPELAWGDPTLWAEREEFSRRFGAEVDALASRLWDEATSIDEFALWLVAAPLGAFLAAAFIRFVRTRLASRASTCPMSPNAVVLSAWEIPAARNALRWEASAAPTAENAVVSPKIVPRRPSSVATFASIERCGRRRERGGSATAASPSAASSIAFRSFGAVRIASAT